jgi:hypothetical protein
MDLIGIARQYVDVLRDPFVGVWNRLASGITSVCQCKDLFARNCSPFQFLKPESKLRFKLLNYGAPVIEKLVNNIHGLEPLTLSLYRNRCKRAEGEWNRKAKKLREDKKPTPYAIEFAFLKKEVATIIQEITSVNVSQPPRRAVPTYVDPRDVVTESIPGIKHDTKNSFPILAADKTLFKAGSWVCDVPFFVNKKFRTTLPGCTLILSDDMESKNSGDVVNYPVTLRAATYNVYGDGCSSVHSGSLAASSHNHDNSFIVGFNLFPGNLQYTSGVRSFDVVRRTNAPNVWRVYYSKIDIENHRANLGGDISNLHKFPHANLTHAGYKPYRGFEWLVTETTVPRKNTRESGADASEDSALDTDQPTTGDTNLEQLFLDLWRIQLITSVMGVNPYKSGFIQ